EPTELVSLLGSRVHLPFDRFVKVKAHPTPEQRRSIDPRLLAGNRFADQWAKKIAALGRLDFERRDRCRKFSRLVRAVGEQVGRAAPLAAADTERLTASQMKA
ncbi:unnamed protein product, partial [Prorocentrum cordatum]